MAFAAATSGQEIERGTLRRVAVRLLPFLLLLYVFSYLDRTNVGLAALQMNAELNLHPSTFGLGGGIFFLGYALFEVPSNLILVRVGARRWLGRIAVTWGCLACAMMWVRTPAQFYTVRLLLGMAEAGFFPGALFYLSQWFPAHYRARAIAGFVIAIPLSQALGAPFGSLLLGLNGVGHLSGWQWLFLLEGLPSVLLGLASFRYLTEHPKDARWLSPQQRDWLLRRLLQESRPVRAAEASPMRALREPLVWLLAVPYFAFYSVALVYSLWGPTLVHEALGTGNAATGLIIGGIALLATVVCMLVASLSDRLDARCGTAALGLALGCVGCLAAAGFPGSTPRVLALVVIAMCGPVFLASFWCLPMKFLQGTSAAAGIALISALGSTGGFVGPSALGFLKELTSSDAGAFFGLAVLALVGSLMCLGLGASRVLRPSEP